MIHTLARLFRGFHVAFGMTGLPDNATKDQERKFVVMWIGILSFIVFWCALLAYLLS